MGLTAASALLLVLAAFPAVFAVTYKVGDTTGWTTGFDYTVWTADKTFRVGDTLEFVYSLSHQVSFVDKAGYDNCDASSATGNFNDGDTKIVLKTVGTTYFLCPIIGHCQGGMKLAVPVLAAPLPPSTPTTPPSPPSPVSSPTASPLPLTPLASPPGNGTPEPQPTETLYPPPPPNSASKGVMSYGIIVVVTLVSILMYNVMS